MELIDIFALSLFATGLVLSVYVIFRFFYYQEYLQVPARSSRALLRSRNEVYEEVIEVDVIYEAFEEVALEVHDDTGVMLPVRFKLCLN